MSMVSRIQSFWMRSTESEDTKWARKRQELGYDSPAYPYYKKPTVKAEASHASSRTGVDFGDILRILYGGGAAIVGLVTFIASWIYCISEYGYLFGVGLGWLPSFIVATIAAYTWPLLLLILIAMIER